MKLMRLSYLLLGLVFLVTFFGVLLLQYPFVSRLPLQEQGISVTDMDHSNFAEGDIYLRPTSQPGIPMMRARWQWCPGFRLLSWCVDIESADLDFSGRFSLGFKSSRLENAVLKLDSLRPAGIQPDFADLGAKLFIEDLVFSDLTCPLRSVEALNATARAYRLTILGMELGDVNISAVSQNRQLTAELTGEYLAGSFVSGANNEFSGDLIVTPPREYSALLDRYTRPTAEGNYEWHLSGVWPCIVS